MFDVMFAEPDRTRPESGQLLNDLARPVKNVYFPTARHDPAGDPYGVLGKDMVPIFAGRTPRADARASITLPLALTTDNWRLGLINLLADEDGVARRHFLHLPAYGWKIPSLPARVASDLGYRVPEREQEGAWLLVKARNQQGYVRLLQMRYNVSPTAVTAAATRPTSAAAQPTAGSPTATTGVRGFDEGALQAAQPNPEALKKMQGLAASARQFAQRAQLVMRTVAYYGQDGKPVKTGK